MKNKILKAFRFHQNDLVKLKHLSDLEGIPQTRVLENLINRYYWEIQRQKTA